MQSMIQVKDNDSVYQSTDTEVAVTDRVKAYRYGKTFVPFAKEDESVLKYQADACMKLIGFTNANNVPSIGSAN